MKVRMSALFVALFAFSSLAYGQDNRLRKYLLGITNGAGSSTVINASNYAVGTINAYTMNTHFYQETRKPSANNMSYAVFDLTPPANYMISEKDFTAQSSVVNSSGSPSSTGIRWNDPIPGGIYRITSIAADSSMITGFAELIYNGPVENVTVSATVQVMSGDGTVEEVGIPAVSACMQNLIPFFAAGDIFNDLADKEETGIAVANPYDFATNVTVTLYSALGSSPFGGSVLSKTIGLPAQGYVSVFIHELFPEIAQSSWFHQSQTLSGQIRITSTTPVPTLTLKTRISGGVFKMSTMPSTCGD